MIDLFSIIGNGSNQIEECHSKKRLEQLAESLHTQCENINLIMKEGRYVLRTFLDCWPDELIFKMSIKLEFIKNKHEDEHKKNTHGQKIHI